VFETNKKYFIHNISSVFKKCIKTSCEIFNCDKIKIIYSVKTTYGTNSANSKLMTFAENAEIGHYLT
jgi:hypothetical protein